MGSINISLRRDDATEAQAKTMITKIFAFVADNPTVKLEQFEFRD